jgi:hypothetical protein
MRRLVRTKRFLGAVVADFFNQVRQHLLPLVGLTEESTVERRLQPLPRLQRHRDRADQCDIDQP